MRTEGARGGRLAARLAYEDELILAYDKSAGLPVIAPDGSRARCLLDIASEQVRRRNPKGRAAVVHRIDRDTSGIVVFARDASSKKLLMSRWDEIVEERLYVALVQGSMGSSEGVLDSHLVEDARGLVREASPRERGAKRAISRWRVLDEGGGMSLLEVRLETGRKHQIRVQLAAVGHPVAGDERYGRSGDRRSVDAGRGPARLCLHAAAIELRLPGARESIRIESPAPPEFAAALRGRPGARATAPSEARRVEGRGGAYASRSASRSASRNAAPRGRASPRSRKPSSRI